jgi:hypothetical protein
MRLAPDAVQNVESDSLTEGYKSKFPLFHKLFLSGVEKSAERSGDMTMGSSGDGKLKAKFKSNDQLSDP